MTTKISILQRSILSAIALLVCNFAIGQTLVSGQLNSGRIPTPTMLFLNVTPDARSAAMGDAGVAISSDVNAIYWNPAKLAFLTDPQTKKQLSAGGSLSYTPWLAKLIDDMAIMNLSGYKRISKQEVIAASLYYFDLGDMIFRDDQGREIGAQQEIGPALSRGPPAPPKGATRPSARKGWCRAQSPPTAPAGRCAARGAEWCGQRIAAKDCPRGCQRSP